MNSFSQNTVVDLAYPEDTPNLLISHDIYNESSIVPHFGGVGAK